MADNSKIEWTDATWNPIAGCSIVSKGCTNCYAMKMAARIETMGTGPHYAGLTQPSKGGPVWTGKIALAPEATLLAPMRRKKPKMFFVNSMSDLFHEDVPDAWIDRIFAVMALCPQHIFQVLTKRPERMRDYMTERWQPALAQRIPDGSPIGFDIPAEKRGEDRSDQVRRECEDLLSILDLADTNRDELWTDAGELKIMQWAWPLPNVWLGTSVEDQTRADERIPSLLLTPAAVHFISAEPLLGPIDLAPWLRFLEENDPDDPRMVFSATVVPGGINIEQQVLDWVIVGGESGPGARPMHPDWARSLRDQCAVSGDAFFFKQWGEWAPGENIERIRGTVETAEWFDERWQLGQENLATEGGHSDDEPDLYRIGKKAAGRTLSGVIHDAMPVRGITS